MRIEALNISGFGVFSNLRAQGLAPGLNLFVGDNEAGKSTFLEFLRNAMFGYPTGTGSRTYVKHPVPPGAKAGGSVLLRLDDGRLWELFWQPKTRSGMQTLFAQDPDGPKQLDLGLYKQICAEMTRQLYSSVYGFSLEELQKLSSLEDDARVASLLYGAGFGLGDISLPEIIKNLEKQRDDIWLPKGEKRLNSLLSRLKETERKIQARQEHLPLFNEIKRSLDALKAEIEKNQAGLALTRANIAVNNDLSKIKQQLPEFEAIKKELSMLGAWEIPPETERIFAENSLEKLKGQEKNASELQHKLNNISREQTELALELVNDLSTAATLGAGAEIQALQEEKGRYSAEEDELQKVLASLGSLSAHPAFKAMFDRETKENSKLLSARLSHVVKQAQELSAIAAEWQMFAQLLNEQPAQNLNGGRLQGPGMLLNPGNPAMLLLALASTAAFTYGVYTSVSDSLWVWAGLAAIWAGLFGIFIKARDLQSKKGQELELQETRQLKLSALTSRARPLLNALKPLIIQAAEQPDNAEPNGPSLEGEDSAGHGAVLYWLQKLTPAKCLELESLLLDWHGRLPGLLERKFRLETGLRELEIKAAALAARVFPELEETSRPFPANLQLLSQALEKARREQLAENKIKGRLEALASQHQETITALQEANEQLASVLAASGFDSVSRLEPVYLDWAKKQALDNNARIISQSMLAQAAGIAEQIPAAQSFIPPDASQPEALLAWLEKEEPDSITARRNRLDAELQAREVEQDRLIREEGELAQRAKTLMADDELETLALEREMLLEEARSLSRRWSVASLSLHYLTEAKRAFEAKHQTKVMKEASGFFRQITGEAYLGLDPSAGENSFAVLAANGESRLPQELSRGTREQLYFALRLALIKNRAKTAEPLPLIMDDVLVNFDPSRLRRAVDAILTLASNHQILYFTCQPHLAPEIMQRAGANQVESRLFEIKNGIVSQT